MTEIAGNNMFSPALGSIGTRSKKSTVTTRLTTPIKYYVSEGKMNRDTIMDMAFACTVSATSESTTLDQWKNLIATFTNTLFDGIVTKLPKDQYQMVKLSDADIAKLRQSFVTLDNATDAIIDDNSTGLPVGAFGGFYPSWDLPIPSQSVAGGWGTYSRSEKTLYAHYALVVFLAGKKITNDNRTAITVARPKALIGKFTIEGVETLNGLLKMSNVAHEMIFQAWLEMSSLKAECFREFSSYTASQTSLGQDIILTNITLMRFAQMNHATIIHKFLLAYPWASELPYLRQPLTLYMDSLAAAAKMPASLQPFIKIIWGDKSGLFPRKDLGALIAVALDTEKEVNETLSSYYSDERFASIVEAFRDDRDRRVTKKNKIGHETVVVAEENETDEEAEEEEEADDAMEVET